MITKSRLSSLADSILVNIPVQSLLSDLNNRLVVLAYHDIRDAGRFGEQMAYVRKAMCPVSLRDVLNSIDDTQQKLPKRAMLITFDDADRSVYERAMPILAELRIPAVAFVVAGHLDTHRAFWWQEVEYLARYGACQPNYVKTLKAMGDRKRRQAIRTLRRSVPGVHQPSTQLKRSELPAMEAAGISIGNHTMTHPLLDRCSDRRVRSEVLKSHQVLAKALGTPPRAFAYPNGNYDPRAAKVIKELGYRLGFLFDHRVGHFPPNDQFQISRVRVSTMTPLDRFRLIVSGLHPMLHHAAGRA